MASVYKRSGRKPYYMEYIDQDGKPHKNISTGITDERVATQLANKIEHDAQRIRAGMPPDHPDVTGKYLGLEDRSGRNATLADVLGEYLADLERRCKRPATLRNYHDILELIFRRNEWTSLVDVTAKSVTCHLAELCQDGRATSTTNAYRDILNTFLRWCVDQGHLAANPIAGVRTGTVSGNGPGRRRALSPDELRSLLADPKSWRRHDQYTVAALTGLRGLELTKIEKRDFDLLTWTWTCRPEVDKEGKLWRLPILPDLRPTIARAVMVLPEPTSRLFPQRTCAHTFGRDLKRSRIAPVDAEGRRVNFHCFRYTFCTMLARRRPMQEVQRFMRHADIRRTANLYTDLGLDDLASGMDTLAGLLDPAKVPTTGPTRAQEENRNAV